MNYAILVNNVITATGTASELWPGVSFSGGQPNAAYLLATGSVLIRSDAAFDPATEILQGAEPYLLNGEVFNTIAAAIPPAPPPQPDYIGFWDATLTSETYQAAYIYSTTSLPMNSALTAYSAAFMNAMNGRVNVGAIQSSIFLVMQAGAGVLTPANLAELQGLMDASNLSSVYTLTPPPAP